MELELQNMLKGARSTPINWPNVIRGIVDNYTSHGANLIDAFQKDAIQNAVDAQDSVSPSEFIVKIKVLTGKFNAVIIEDYGTFGLTGKILMEKDLQKELNTTERWGRFESLAFRKDSAGKTLGARGQGKFLLLSINEKLNLRRNKNAIIDDDPPTMLYDTKTRKGSYRLGCRVVLRTESPINYWTGKEAEKYIKDFTLGELKPIDHIGTRIIIPNPKKELINAAQDGNLERMIGVTWFPLLIKNPDFVQLIINNKKIIVDADKRLREMPSDDNEKCKVWKKSATFSYRNKKRKLKIHMCCLDSNKYATASEDIRHLGIYRSGMKVMSISNQQIPKEIMDRIYGFVEVDELLESELRKVEDPTHYHFDLRKGAAKKLKTFIETEILIFAKEKLGYLEETEKDKQKKRSTAERKALNVLNELSREFKLTGLGPMVPQLSVENTPEQPEINFRVSKLKFPVPGSRRINYGEYLSNIKCHLTNNSSQQLDGTITINVTRGRNSIFILKKFDIKLLQRKKIVLNYNDLHILTSKFKTPGKFFMKYTFEQNNEKHLVERVIISRKQPFWVEADPPEKGIFKELQPINFEGTENSDLTGMAQQNEGHNWIFYYNITHPSYLSYPDPELDLPEYVAEKAIPWLAYIDVVENDIEDRKIFHDDIDPKILINFIKSIGKLEGSFYSAT